MNLRKGYFLSILFTLIVCFGQCQSIVGLQEGDVVFQTSNSGQSKAIQLATGSKFSHCGIIVKVDGKLKVVEAVQPVKITEFKDWVKRGNNSYYEVKRLRDQTLVNEESKKQLHLEFKKLIGVNYDIYFDWSDKEIYCSELVWKLYKRAFNIEICPLHQLNEYNLDHPAVKKKLQERYGNNIPLTEKMVSPADIYNSTLLESVKR